MTDSAFWRFSLRFYALDRVAPACLAVQDGAGADVNLLLYLLFLAERPALVSDPDVVRLDAAVKLWREQAVVPLRALRRTLKTGVGEVPLALTEPFRNQIKKVELESERLEQTLLEQTGSGMRFSQAADRMTAARENLAVYGRFLGGFPDKPSKILLAAFTNPVL